MQFNPFISIILRITPQQLIGTVWYRVCSKDIKLSSIKFDEFELTLVRILVQNSNLTNILLLAIKARTDKAEENITHPWHNTKHHIIL